MSALDMFYLQAVFRLYLWDNALNITPKTFCKFFREI